MVQHLIQEETCNYIMLYDKLNYTEFFDWFLHMIYWRTGASKASKFISILDSMLPSACTVIDH